MSHKHHSRASHTRAHKRAQFERPASKRNNTASILTITLAALAGVAAYLVMGSVNEKPRSAAVSVAKQSPAQNAGAPAGGDITIPISEVSNGEAKFFDYAASDNRSVRFFVLKSSDGVYRAALDACDVCYWAKQGYYQEGDNMVCRKCRRQFPSALVNEVSGGCNPVPLARTVDGDKVVIRANELEGRKDYF
jgi:uncharacterized membrane protein